MENENKLEVVSIRLVEEQPLISNRQISTPEDAVSIIGKNIKNWDRECLCVVNLNTKGKPINMNIVSVGTLNGSLAAGREVFKSAILSNAKNIIILHNHPSGDPTPSKDDILVTNKLIHGGNLLDIEVIDHIIVGENNFYSMRQKGIIDVDKRLDLSSLTWNKNMGKELSR